MTDKPMIDLKKAKSSDKVPEEEQQNKAKKLHNETKNHQVNIGRLCICVFKRLLARSRSG